MKHLTISWILSLAAPIAAAAQYEPIDVFLSGSGPKYGSPVVAEVDGNSENGKEIVVASASGIVSLVSSSGSVLWETSLPISACSALSGSNRLLSTPAVGKLYRNQGTPYVVVGYGGIGGTECGGGVAALRGDTGEIAWNFDLKQFAARRRIFALAHSVISSPALFDFNGDGNLEVSFGALDRNIYVINHNGRFRAYYQAADTVFSSPAVATPKGADQAAIVIGTDISLNRKLRPPTPNGGYLYALKSSLFARGRVIGFRQTGSAYWRSQFDQVVQSSPTVGELVSSNEGLEVAVATGCFFPQDLSIKRGRYLRIVSLKTGATLRQVELPACTNSEPAIADINGDELNEVVLPVQTLAQYGGSGPSQVLAYQPETDATLWMASPRVNGSNLRELALFSGLAIADLDQNGSREVVVASGSGVTVFAGSTGEYLSCEERECDDGRFAFKGFSALRNAVAIDDLDGDGDLEMVVAGSSSGGGKVSIYSGLSSLISSSPGSSAGYLPWPTYRQDARHRGVQSGF